MTSLEDLAYIITHAIQTRVILHSEYLAFQPSFYVDPITEQKYVLPIIGVA